MTLDQIWEFLENQLEGLSPAIIKRKSNENMIEYAGTKEVMQGKQKVAGHYFASIVKKPKDVRLYFFPIYTHLKEYGPLSQDLKKMLKGKSCFHVKQLNPKLEEEIMDIISKGKELYLKDQLI